MNSVWLIAPAGVCAAVFVTLLYRLWPKYHESRAARLLEKGRDRAAARSLETALRLWTARRGAGSLAAASALAGLARVRYLQGLRERGDAHLDRAIEIAQTHAKYGVRSRALIQTLQRAGRAAFEGERHENAALLGAQASRLAAGMLKPADPLRGAIDTLLADTYAAQGQFDAAEDLYEAALATYRAALGEDSAESGAVLASMAAALAREERWREAREAGLEAVEILDHAGSALLPEALNALAELHARRGRLAEAEGLRVSICQLWERLGGIESAALARELERRADLLRSMERVTEAGYLQNRAAQIRRTVLTAMEA